MALGPGLDEEGQTHSWRASEPRTIVVKETALGGQAGRVQGGGLLVTEHGGCSTGRSWASLAAWCWRGDRLPVPGKKLTENSEIQPASGKESRPQGWKPLRGETEEQAPRHAVGSP